MNVSVPDQGKVIRFYGEDLQACTAMEECAELIQAISKMVRLRHDALPPEAASAVKVHDSLAEELADCLIMMDQLQVMFCISDGEIQKMVDRKCARQEARMHDALRRNLEG